MYQKLLGLLAGLMLIPASFAYAKGDLSVNIRPLDDFLSAQGATTQFVPPVPDYVGWVDEDLITFTLIDYAGLANEFIETESDGAISLNTNVQGIITEREQSDGRARVRVQLVTKNALAWAFLIADADFDNDPLPFLNTPLSFGARAQDVLEGADPSLGATFFNLWFMNTAPDAPLPDLVQLLNEPQPEQIPLQFSFRALAPGANSNGEQSLLEVRQVCRGELDDEDTVAIVCEKEIVDINSEQ